MASCDTALTMRPTPAFVEFLQHSIGPVDYSEPHTVEFCLSGCACCCGCCRSRDCGGGCWSARLCLLLEPLAAAVVFREALFVGFPSVWLGLGPLHPCQLRSASGQLGTGFDGLGATEAPHLTVTKTTRWLGEAPKCPPQPMMFHDQELQEEISSKMSAEAALRVRLLLCYSYTHIDVPDR